MSKKYIETEDNLYSFVLLDNELYLITHSEAEQLQTSENLLGLSANLQRDIEEFNKEIETLKQKYQAINPKTETETETSYDVDYEFYTKNFSFFL